MTKQFKEKIRKINKKKFIYNFLKHIFPFSNPILYPVENENIDAIPNDIPRSFLLIINFGAPK